uniref:Vacuolar cation/proton exchanger n=1 Tax=Zea mays TaxID=4577 RepID=B6U903_MAIZE|nr:vacuolar cation/proton exchanger 2 [Zea mays]|eukprot:NP_001152113.1 vacuolar cation/proton exchanger 2 [Zea mays]
MATDSADAQRLLLGRQNSHQQADGADGFEDNDLAAPPEPLSRDNGASFRRNPSSADSSSGVFGSLKAVLLKSKLNLLIPCGFLAVLVDCLSQNKAWVFPLSLLGIIPLAERLGFATEQLGLYTGRTAGGLLNATFGNATELVISIHALRSGKLRVVQQSLLGSILSNTLLVLGCAFFGGGLTCGRTEQVFRKEDAVLNSGLLLMAVMGLVSPAMLYYTHTEANLGESALALSRFSSCVMLFAYAAFVFFELSNSRRRDESTEGGGGGGGGDQADDDCEYAFPEITKWEAIAWLAIFTAWISVFSDFLVGAIEGAAKAWKIPVAFISTVLLPIVGNAAEHASAVMFAMKDKLDLSLGVAIGSSTQISMFVIPFSVVAGWMMGQPMDLNFHLFETASLLITVLVVALLLQDGTSNCFKGLMLILCYLIVAASFYVYADPNIDG